MSFYGWRPYVSVAMRRAQAEKLAARAAKKGHALSPVPPFRGAIASTFWGRAWCANLEHYSDFSNRLPRGRSYVRNGSVIDLIIAEGEVLAQVLGSSLYRVRIGVSRVPEKRWETMGKECASSIDSLVELLQGRLSKGVMERICQPGTGLFPAPREITLDCSCPDWADMCKHVAAVLYGVGSRLDTQPELLFRLRKVNPQDLVAHAAAGLPGKRKAPATGKVLDDARIADVFGLDIDDGLEVAKSVDPVITPSRVKSSKSVKTGVKPRRKSAGKIIKRAPATKVTTAKQRRSRLSG